jgi:hypothetical protein
MRTPLQFVCPACATSALASTARWFTLAGILLLASAIAWAQGPPPEAVGEVEGNDVSVEGGTPARSGTAALPPSIYVSNGSSVTVHSGRARLLFFTGGEFDLCGPAKFTVLLSGNSITLALNFGRVHVKLPAQTSLRVYSPTIIATPLEISGGSRDFTVGLDLDDSVCVLATSGAIQLEHQFTGEKLIVPQAGEFFLSGGKLVPVASSRASCRCLADEKRVAPPAAAPPLRFAESATPRAVTRAVVPAAEESQPAPAPAVEPVSDRSVELSVVARSNETHPLAPAKGAEAAPQPPTSAPVYTVVVPPLEFSASSPAPPPDRTPDMFLLIREARILPDWEFVGRVEVPSLVEAVQRALGEKPTTGEPAPPPKKKKGGFWASLKRLFGGD